MAQRRTQFFSYGELPLVLLALLAAAPANGYELMHELGRLFAPAYKPSAGGVYPAVNALKAEGLIALRPVEGKPRYVLSANGRKALERRLPDLAEIELRTGARLGPSAGLAPILARFTQRIEALSGHLDPTTVEHELETTARRLEALRHDQR